MMISGGFSSAPGAFVLAAGVAWGGQATWARLLLTGRSSCALYWIPSRCICSLKNWRRWSTMGTRPASRGWPRIWAFKKNVADVGPLELARPQDVLGVLVELESAAAPQFFQELPGVAAPGGGLLQAVGPCRYCPLGQHQHDPQEQDTHPKIPQCENLSSMGVLGKLGKKIWGLG